MSDFWISKYKVTYAEFDVFTDATGKAKRYRIRGAAQAPADSSPRAYWHEAKNYCQWIGQLTGLPIDFAH